MMNVLRTIQRNYGRVQDTEVEFTPLQKMHLKNKDDLNRIQSEISKKVGHDIDLQALIEVSVRRLVECYNNDEIIYTLEHFELI